MQKLLGLAVLVFAITGCTTIMDPNKQWCPFVVKDTIPLAGSDSVYVFNALQYYRCNSPGDSLLARP